MCPMVSEMARPIWPKLGGLEEGMGEIDYVKIFLNLSIYKAGPHQGTTSASSRPGRCNTE